MELISKVEQLFTDIDAKITRFKEASALRCVDGCGECCKKRDIEATVLEFLPLAAYLWEKGEALSVLEKLESDHMPDTCVFFASDPGQEGKGCCSVYSFRGLICRLFGFSVVLDKNSKPRFSTCTFIKEQHPTEFHNAEKLIEEGFDVPVMIHYASRLISIDPDLGRKFLPINIAIRTAIEKIGLSRWLDSI